MQRLRWELGPAVKFGSSAAFLGCMTLLFTPEHKCLGQIQRKMMEPTVAHPPLGYVLPETQGLCRFQLPFPELAFCDYAPGCDFPFFFFNSNFHRTQVSFIFQCKPTEILLICRGHWNFRGQEAQTCLGATGTSYSCLQIKQFAVVWVNLECFR